MERETQSCLQIQNRLHRKYDPIFSFYYARNVRPYIRKKPHNLQFVQFADYQYLDNSDEFFKRSYRMHQIPDRIHLLEAYFKRNRLLHNQSPFIINPKIRECLRKRIKRRVKANKKIKEFDMADPFAHSQTFLHSVTTNRLEASEGDSVFRSEHQVTYQSRLYDIYNPSLENTSEFNSNCPASSVTLTNLMTLPIQEEDNELGFSTTQDQLSHLMCDFQDKDVERIVREYNQLNLKPPKTPLLNLKLNLDRLSQSRNDDSIRPEESVYDKFYEAMRKKVDGKKTNKVYYVKGAQKLYHLTSRLANNQEPKYNFLTYRQGAQLLKTKAEIMSGQLSDRVRSPSKNRLLSPEFQTRQRVDSMKQIVVSGKDAEKLLSTYKQPTERLLTGQNTDREMDQQLTERQQKQNHYKRILDRMRENKKQEMLARANSPQHSMDPEEKTKKIDQLKSKAVQLLGKSKGPAAFQSGQLPRTSNSPPFTKK